VPGYVTATLALRRSQGATEYRIPPQLFAIPPGAERASLRWVAGEQSVPAWCWCPWTAPTSSVRCQPPARARTGPRVRGHFKLTHLGHQKLTPPASVAEVWDRSATTV
jgi:hypothetical protein